MERTILTILMLVLPSIVTTEEYDVLILGAGLSGIGAAQYLHKRKFTNFLVLEGKNYIGGRLKSEPFHGLNVELGGNWIHHWEDNHDAVRLAKKVNLKTVRDSYTDVTYRNGENGALYRSSIVKNVGNHLQHQLRKMDINTQKRMQNGKCDISLQAGLRWAGWSKKNLIADAVEYFAVDFENAVNSEQISASGAGFTGGGHDEFVIDQRGYVHPFLHLSKQFKDKFLLNQEITSVKKFGSTYTVYTKAGKTFRSKHVLVTFSSGVLNSRAINFYPDLPAWKYESLAMIPMGHYCKIFLLFDKKFWDDTNYIIFTNKIRGHYMHWQNLENYVNKKMLLATLTGSTCYESHLFSDAEIKNQAFDALKKVYKDAVRPIDMIRNNWSTDKFFQGAYSYPVPGITDDDYIGIQHPVRQSLWFAGEYTKIRDQGYTHGAYETGRDTAKRIYECIRSSSKCPQEDPPFSFNKKK